MDIYIHNIVKQLHSNKNLKKKPFCQNLIRLVLFKTEANSHMWLFKFKWTKIRNVVPQCRHYLKFYWSTVTHIYVLFHILSHYGLSQDAEYNSLSYIAGPCCLSIPYMTVCICWSQTPNPSLLLPLPLHSRQAQVCSLCLWVCFIDMSICITF